MRSTCGPMMIPPTISNTTAGIRSDGTKLTTKGAPTATSDIQRRSVNTCQAAASASAARARSLAVMPPALCVLRATRTRL